MSARWIEQDESVPVWRHAVWYDGVCMGLAIMGFLAVILAVVFG